MKSLKQLNITKPITLVNEESLQVMVNERLFEAKHKYIHSDYQPQEVKQMTNDIG